MMFTFAQKSRVPIRVLYGSVSFVFVLITLFVPHPSHAQFVSGTVELPGPLLTAALADTVANVQTSTGTSLKTILDGLAWTVAKVAVQSLTRSTVNWINTGFQGSPAFVSDLNQNLQFLGDAVANNFINELNQTVVSATGFNIKSPFQDQIAQQLRAEYYRTTGSFGLNYTLNETSADPKAFLAGDFSQGGLDAFASASQNPGNNPYGAYLLASNQLFAQIDAAAAQRKEEIGWGKGFLPWRGNCNPTNTTASTQAANATVALQRVDQCLFGTVKTPGSVIESQLENSLGSGIRQLELADSINEIVGALASQLVTQALGATGLSGASQPSSGGGASYIDRASTQTSSLNTSLATGVSQNITNDLQSIIVYKGEWQQILEAATRTQNTCGTNDDTSSAIEQANTAIGRGNAAQQQLTTVQTDVQSAIQSTASNKSTLISMAITGYQSYLSSAGALSSSDLAYAKEQSTNTSGLDQAPSLYTHMKELQNSCRS